MFAIRNTYSVVLVLAFVSCSRTGTPPGKNCKIITATINSGATVGKYTYEYNSDDKLSRTLLSGDSYDTVTYSYSGNKIFRAHGTGPTAPVDTLTVNDAGFLLYRKTAHSPLEYNAKCVYDANGQLMSYTTYYPSDTSTSTFVFTNGDYTSSLGSDGSTDTLIYDLSKPAANADMGERYRLENGAYTVKSKHLLLSEKEVNNNGTITSAYSYQFDGNGNVSVCTIKGSNNITTTIAYTYSCQ